DAALRAGGAGGKVGDGEGAGAGHVQAGGERHHPGVAGREGVVVGQGRPRVGAGEGDGGGVAGGGVAEGVLGRDREGVHVARGRGRREGGDDKGADHRRVDLDVRLRALGHRGRQGVGGGEGPGAGCLERGGEGVHAGVVGREGVVGRQARL